MVELLLNAYEKMTETGSAEKIEKGYLPFISLPSINAKKIKKAEPIEAKTLCAYLFDGIDIDTVDRYICPKGGSLSAMLLWKTDEKSSTESVSASTSKSKTSSERAWSTFCVLQYDK